MRAEKLDETIDILTLFYQRKPFDYDGEHYHLKLTLMDEMHYPAKPIQQPRIPIWTPVVWPKTKSMQRMLKCDGALPEKRDPEGQPVDVTPEDVREMRAYVEANRTLTTPFDIVASGKTNGLDRSQQKDTVLPWVEAGATWWMEGLWGMSNEEVAERIRQGPPKVD